jgi:hypothetical protein
MLSTLHSSLNPSQSITLPSQLTELHTQLTTTEDTLDILTITDTLDTHTIMDTPDTDTLLDTPTTGTPTSEGREESPPPELLLHPTLLEEPTTLDNLLSLLEEPHRPPTF